MRQKFAKLGDVADFYAGTSLPDGIPFRQQKAGYLLVRVSDLNLPGNEIRVGSSHTWSPSPGIASATCPAEALIIPKRGGAIGTNKKRISVRPCILDPNLMGIKPHPDILDHRFLYHWFLGFDLSRITSGSSVPQLNKKDLRPLQIPLPPIDMQRKVSAALDQADALLAKRRAAIALLDDLAQSVFLDLFSNPASDWPMVTVEEVAAPKKGSIRTGPFGSQLLHDEFVDSGIAVLGIDNAVANEFRWGKSRFITPDKYKQLSRYTVRPGDVLITIMGTCGRCAIVPDDIPTAINTKHLCCITLDRARILPEFLHSYFLMHSSARSYLHKTAKGAIMSGLNMSIIKALPLHLPPIELQQTFARQLRSVQLLKSGHASHLRKLDDLFRSLQNRAFRGELWEDRDI